MTAVQFAEKFGGMKIIASSNLLQPTAYKSTKLTLTAAAVSGVKRTSQGPAVGLQPGPGPEELSLSNGHTCARHDEVQLFYWYNL